VAAIDDEGFQLFLNQAADHPLLTGQQERDLSRAAKAGDKRALERLVSCNYRLVLSIARSFQNRGLGMADLVQEGVVGLHIAADKFNPDLGYKFSTYATWWVRKSIQRGLANCGADTIRLPAGLRQRRGRARAVLRKNSSMTIEEVAAELDEPVELVRQAMEAPEVVASMDADQRTTRAHEDGDSLWSILGDPHADDPYDLTVDDVPAGLAQAVADLPELQRHILELRFGLGGNKPLTIRVIAEHLGRPQHYVQSAQATALRTLRAALTPEPIDVP
jgi:RNA polymerase nonessential primary-like sigma factor